MPQKLKIMIGGEVLALLDTGCELSILNEQLNDKLLPFGLNCLELPTQHLSLVIVFNEKSNRIRKQALLKIQIGDSTVDQVVLLSLQFLTDAILGLDFLIDHAAELSFPHRAVSLKINLLKPSDHVMHHRQFNIQQLYALPTLYLCVLYLSENKQRLVPLIA